MLRLALPLLALPLVSACVERDGYPSLLPRGAEKVGFDEPAAPPPAPVAADPALDARIATARQANRDALATTGAAIARAERLAAAARGKAAGSEAWLDAQVALADLDTLRSDRLATLTDLEQLAGERAAALQPDYPALDAAIDEARSAIAAQTARIAALQEQLEP